VKKEVALALLIVVAAPYALGFAGTWIVLAPATWTERVITFLLANAAGTLSIFAAAAIIHLIGDVEQDAQRKT